MAAPSPCPTNVRLKLLIEPKSQTLLYAEAGKDFVDFLFSIMSLPVGTMIRLLSKEGTAGSIGNIYESIENLGDSYMLSVARKVILLKAQAFYYSIYVPLLFPSMEPPTYTTCYMCNRNSDGFSCLNLPTNVGEGFVKEAVTYMIMDDLVVRPMSTKSIITLLNKFSVKDVGCLEEKVIAVGVKEGVELLRASMQSKTVLTTVFLGTKESSMKSEPVVCSSSSLN